jgi:hypothetical protein
MFLGPATLSRTKFSLCCSCYTKSLMTGRFSYCSFGEKDFVYYYILYGDQLPQRGVEFSVALITRAGPTSASAMLRC